MRLDRNERRTNQGLIAPYFCGEICVGDRRPISLRDGVEPVPLDKHADSGEVDKLGQKQVDLVLGQSDGVDEFRANLGHSHPAGSVRLQGDSARPHVLGDFAQPLNEGIQLVGKGGSRGRSHSAN